MTPATSAWVSSVHGSGTTPGPPLPPPPPPPPVPALDWGGVGALEPWTPPLPPPPPPPGVPVGDDDDVQAESAKASETTAPPRMRRCNTTSPRFGQTGGA